MSFEIFRNIIVDYWPMFLRGAGITLLVSVVGTVCGFVIGLIVGVIRTIPVPEKGVKKYILKLVNALLGAYIEVFRGTPMIVQAMVIYYGSSIVFGFHMDVLYAAFIIVSINTGAYMAEIIRGGIISIDKGQFEAAHAIGMNHYQTMVNVVLPQAIRNSLPATGNEFIINIKDTSVLNVISLNELFFGTKSVAGNTFNYFAPFTIACVIYLAMTLTITKILRTLESKLDGPANYTMMGNQMQLETPEDIARKMEERH